MKFGLIGDGYIAQYHKEAIEYIQGSLEWIYDPIKFPDRIVEKNCVDYVIICSPTYCHRDQIKEILNMNSLTQIIVEKPAFLPWEPIIEDDRINIVLQLRWADLPKTADNVRIRMVRDEKYFQTWKGDPKLTGGLFYNLFIHYIDIAIRLNAEFTGFVAKDGCQMRFVDTIDLLQIDMQKCYNKMYEDILIGNGVKVKDIFYLTWMLSRNSEFYGYGVGALNKGINISRDLL